jgi:hypothetical protein
MYTDSKIVLYAAACGLAYWSHFIVKFPTEYKSIIIALVCYSVIMGIHWIIENKLENQAFYISKSHQIKELKDFPKLYIFSEIDEQKTKIEYSFEILGYSATGASVNAMVTYDCTKLFDTHGYLHLLQVHKHLIEPCIA